MEEFECGDGKDSAVKQTIRFGGGTVLNGRTELVVTILNGNFQPHAIPFTDHMGQD